jgi:hypothetical protein
MQVTVTAIDDAGNDATCTFTVTVQDTGKPSITCPAAITVNAPSTGPSTAVTWDTPATSDNWGVDSVTSDISSGASFSIGSQIITYTVTDNADLTATCSFTVIVKDVTPPSITCPDSLVLNTDTDKHYATVTLAAATAVDNSGAVVPLCNQSSGQYPLGLHSVCLPCFVRQSSTI